MLIHKTTMGVLTRVWNTDGTVLIKASFARCPYLNKDEWWEVSPKTTIGKIALRYYPFITPVVQDGNLIDLIPQRRYEKEVNLCLEEKRDDAKKRGYSQCYKKTS